MDKNINNKKLISIVIPAYNVSKYIKQSLFSVLSQSYKNIEIIIVNDGATDNTGEIIEEYAKKDIRIIVITQENKGLAAARNTGLRNAKGEYICILDSDDVMLPDKILKQYEFLEIHPEYDITYSDLYHFMDGKTHIYYHPMAQLSIPQYDSLLYGNIINPNTVFFRKSVFEKYGGFDESLRSAEDWEYWLNLSLNGVIFGFQKDKLTLYRIRRNSLSSNLIMMSIAPIKVLEKQLNRQINEKQKQIIELMVTYWYKRLYVLFLKNKNIKEARLIEDKILKSNIFFKFIILIPLWLFNIIYYLFLKHNFLFRYKRIKDLKIENYLKIVEQHGKLK